MSTQPPVAPQTPIPSADLDKMLSFLVTQNELQRTYFDGLFTKTVTVLGILIAAVGVVATFVGVNTVAGVKQAAENAANTSVTSRLNELRPQIDMKINEGVSGQFKTEKIEAVVQSAAKEATITTANKLIRNEVRDQVGTAISREQASIQPIMESAADKAVDQVKEGIQRETDAEVERITKERIEPQLRDIASSTDEATQSALARIGVGTSLDRLIQMSNDNHTLPEVRKAAATDAEDVIQSGLKETVQGVCSMPNAPLSEILPRLKSDDPNVLIGIVNCVETRPYFINHQKPDETMTAAEQQRFARFDVERLYTALDPLLHIMTTNRFIQIRELAFDSFASIVGHGKSPAPDIRRLDNVKNIAWWNLHRHEYGQ